MQAGTRALCARASVARGPWSPTRCGAAAAGGAEDEGAAGTAETMEAEGAVEAAAAAATATDR